MKIFRSAFIFTACFALTAALAGCGMFGSASPEAPPAPPSPVVEYMMTHGRGDSAELDDPQFGGHISIAMQESFVSASGEECRRATLVAREREAEMVVICRKGEDAWKLAPRIWGQGIE